MSAIDKLANMMLPPRKRNNRNSEKTSELAKHTILENNLPTESIELNYYLLSSLYKDNGIAKIIIDKPVDVGFAKKIEIKENNNKLDEEDVLKLEKVIKKKRVYYNIQRAIKLARQYGGSVIVINAINGVELDKQLTEDEIKQYGVHFTPVDKFQGIFVDYKSYSSISIENQNNINYFRIKSILVHPSRVIIFNGEATDSFHSTILQGWGVSVLSPCLRSIKMFLKATNVALELLDEAKLTILKSSDKENLVMSSNELEERNRHVQAIADGINYKTVTQIQAGDEIIQLHTDLSSLVPQQKFCLELLALESGIPQSYFLGESSSGFSSGQDSLEIFANLVQYKVHEAYSDQITRMITLLVFWIFDIPIQELDIEIIFPTPRTSSPKEEAELKSTRLNNILALQDRGIIDNDQAKELINKENLFISSI